MNTKNSIFIFLMTSLSCLHANAQPITSLTGQYGCMANRNFGGYDLALIQGTDDGNITGSNFMMYIDFTNKSMEFNVVGSKTWGVSKIIKGEIAVTNGKISIENGPLTNSFLIKSTISTPKQSHLLTFNLMPVNGGATLLLQSGTSGNGDSTPIAGACNKI